MDWLGIWLRARSGQELIAVIALLIMTVFVIAAMIEKYLSLTRSKKSSRIYAPQIAAAFKASNWDKAMALSEVYAERSHLASIVYEGLKERENVKGTLPEEAVVRHMNEAMSRQIIVISGRYRTNVGGIDAIGKTAPFVGALGGSPTTLGLGIILAIPAIWLTNYIENRIAGLEAEMRHAASEIVTFGEALIVKSEMKANELKSGSLAQEKDYGKKEANGN